MMIDRKLKAQSLFYAMIRSMKKEREAIFFNAALAELEARDEGVAKFSKKVFEALRGVTEEELAELFEEAERY